MTELHWLEETPQHKAERVEMLTRLAQLLEDDGYPNDAAWVRLSLDQHMPLNMATYRRLEAHRQRYLDSGRL